MDETHLLKVIALARVATAVEQPTQADWEEVETNLAVTLPDDFKTLVSTLGSGHFGELVLKNPASSSEYAHLRLADVLYWHNGIAWIAKKAGVSLYPNRDGFLCLGTTGFGCQLFVQTSSEVYRICWLDLDVYRARILKMSLCQFLHDIYLGLIASKWTKEDRAAIWGEGHPFFNSRPGVIDTGEVEELN